MQENSESKGATEMSTDGTESSKGQFACGAVRPLPVLMSLCLSAILPVSLLVLTVFAIFNACSGNSIICCPIITIPLIVVVVVQLARVEIGLWKGKNWARCWVIEFALVWLIGLVGSLISGVIKGPAPFFVAIIVIPILSRIIPAILLALPSARCWFNKASSVRI